VIGASETRAAFEAMCDAVGVRPGGSGTAIVSPAQALVFEENFPDLIVERGIRLCIVRAACGPKTPLPGRGKNVSGMRISGLR